jgi:hypothetical protein
MTPLGVPVLGDGRLVVGEDVGALAFRGSQQRFVAVVDGDPMFHRGAVGLEQVDQRCEVVLKEHDPRPGMVQDARHLLLREAHVERHDDRARLNDTVVALHQRVVVEADEGHAIARLHAEALERGGQALGSFAELGVGEGAVAGDDRGVVAKHIHGPVQKP